jgi:hypothetical protein
MKKIAFIILIILPFGLFSQSDAFKKEIDKTRQSYMDRGYKLVSEKADSIFTGKPLVTPEISLDYQTYYIVLVQLDGCFYCEYKLQYVDDQDFLLDVDFDYEVKDGLKQGVYKFDNKENKNGKYVVFLDSDLPYYANIFVFKK